MTKDQTDAATQEVYRWIDKANVLYCKSMSYPEVSFDLRGATAGQACYSKWTIRINAVLLVENWDTIFDRTIPHEVAHLVARGLYSKYGRIKPHGREWKSVMRKFGKEPSRCHSYDVSNSTARTVARDYIYKCPCKTYDLTIIRHRRMQSGRRKYSCPRCHTPLQYIGMAA